jgi:hypothetical protein
MTDPILTLPIYESLEALLAAELVTGSDDSVNPDQETQND